MSNLYIAALKYDCTFSRKENYDSLVDHASLIKLSDDTFSFVDLCIEESKYIGVLLEKVHVLKTPLKLVNMKINTSGYII